MKYADKLKDPRWQKKRLEILERDGWECRLCGDKDSTLHVHHKYYQRGADPWDIEPVSLITLCESCHDEEFSIRDEINEMARSMQKFGFMSGDFNGLREAFECLPVRDHFYGGTSFMWALSVIIKNPELHTEIMRMADSELSKRSGIKG